MSPKNLQQIWTDCVSIAKTTKSVMVQNGNLFKWKGCVTSFVVVNLKYYCTPHFGFTISDSSASIPCIIINPVNTICSLLQFCGQTVMIRDPKFVVEVVITESKQYDLIHLLVEDERISVVEESLNTTGILPVSYDTSIINEALYNVNMVPLKISPVILTAKSEIFCLVLASLLLKGEQDIKEVWLILKNEQVIWKDSLLPSRIYTIYLPFKNHSDFVASYQSLYSIADKNLDTSFTQMLHHKELCKTNVSVYLPKSTQVSSSFVFFNDISCDEWFSVADKHLYSLKFASVYGLIYDIQYIESWKTSSCPWCDTPSGFSTVEECSNSDEQQTTENHREWSIRPLESKQISTTKIILPNLQMEVPIKERNVGFGIRGGSINVQIAIRDISSSQISYIYLKRWKLQQYPAGLIKGVLVCFTDVNIKNSKRKNLYFVNTPLTRIIHLKATDELNEDTSTTWGRFGFPNLHCNNEKIWGALDLDFLAKVSLVTKCKLCQQQFVQYSCPNVFCSNNKRKIDNTYEVVATARLLVRGINGFEASSLYLKNDYVRMYLDIPKRIWEKLCRLSARSELLYFYRMDISSELENANPLQIFFYLYCKHFRPKNRFHVLCRKFKGEDSGDKKYFCVDMKTVNTHRLAMTRAALDKCLDLKKK